MNKEDLLTIINHYGVMPQLKKFQEEVFELNEAIIRHDEEAYTPDDSNEYIAEEIADVYMMLSQFREYYAFTNEYILQIANQKIKRQLGRIEDEKC